MMILFYYKKQTIEKYICPIRNVTTKAMVCNYEFTSKVEEHRSGALDVSYNLIFAFLSFSLLFCAPFDVLSQQSQWQSRALVKKLVAHVVDS